MWTEQNCKEIDNMKKYNQQNKAHKLIKLYFSEKKTQCTHIKDKEGNLLIDKIAIANRQKECLEEDNTDSPVENLIDKNSVSNTNTGTLKSEFEEAIKAFNLFIEKVIKDIVLVSSK